jgi:secreted trypsin-like serine protease
VIRTGWVLTAAHCLTDEGGVPVLTGGHRIRLGLYNPLDDEGYTYRILRVIPHPDFQPSTFAFDVALVQYDPKGEKLGGQVYPIARIRLDPQPITARTIRARMPAYTFGWGRTALEGGAPPEELRGARLELRDLDSCTRLTSFRDKRRDAVLCAAGARGEQACFGDSGGPLITYGDAGGVPTLLGVVSAGVKCGRTSVPSRFTRIAHPLVQRWLNAILPGTGRR